MRWIDGLDISERKPRAATSDDLQRAARVVLMKPGLSLPSEPRSQVQDWQFPDPAAWDMEAVRPLRDAVADQVEREVINGH